MQYQKEHEQTGQHSGMQSKKTSQRMMSVTGTTDYDPLQVFSNNGHQCHQVCRHVRGPVTFLIPRQQIAGEPQAQHDLHQDQPEPKVNLAWCPVRSVNDNLEQVQGQ